MSEETCANDEEAAEVIGYFARFDAGLLKVLEGQ